MFLTLYAIHCMMHSSAPKKILKSALYASRRIKNQFPVLIVANVINNPYTELNGLVIVAQRLHLKSCVSKPTLK